MPSAEPLRIFISYARKDGATLAQRLQADLTRQGYDVWLDMQRITGGAVWSSYIERETQSSDEDLRPGHVTEHIETRINLARMSALNSLRLDGPRPSEPCSLLQAPNSNLGDQFVSEIMYFRNPASGSATIGSD